MTRAHAQLAELEATFTALAHASRRQILLVIWFRGGEMSAGEIAGRFAYKWPTITRHLQVLETAGLLTHVRKGRQRIYRVNTPKLKLAREWLNWFDADPQSSTNKEPDDGKKIKNHERRS